MDRMYQAFIASQNERYGPLTFFLRIWDIQEVLRTGLFVAQLVTFDGVLVGDPFVLPGQDRIAQASGLSSSACTLSGGGTCG